MRTFAPLKKVNCLTIKSVRAMKKVFMSLAVVAMMVAAASCGNNASKKAAAEAEAAQADSTCCVADSCSA